jgi:hypothetical protein
MATIVLQFAGIMVGMKKLALLLALVLWSAHVLGQTYDAIQGNSFVGGIPATTSGMNSSNYLNGIIPGASITVYLTGTTTKATIYKNGSLAPLSNPFFSNASGATNPGGWIFWAADGQGYDVQAQGGIGNSSCTTAPLCYTNATTLMVDAKVGSGGSGTGTGLAIINVTSNSYGYNLVADGTTDNCTTFNNLESARPSGSTLYFPKGTSFYHFNGTCSTTQGLLMTKPGTYFGDGVGAWNGTTFVGGTLLDATVTSYQLGTVIHDIAVDVSSSSTYLDCFDLGYGSAIYVGDYVQNWACNARGLGTGNQGHALLVQGGAGYRISNGQAFNAFHATGIRASSVKLDGLYSYNGYDVIVKSASSSGGVANVTVSNVICNGPSAGTGCGMYVTSQAGSVSTTNVVFNNITENNSAYGIVAEADSGGVIYDIAFNNVQATNLTGGVYYYYGDSNVSNSITGVSVNNSTFTTLSGNAFQNSANAVYAYLNNTYARNVTGSYTVGSFLPSPSSGWSVWSGLANDASLSSMPQTASTGSASESAEYSTGSSTYNQTLLRFSNTDGAGLPGMSIIGTTTAYSTRGVPGSITTGHSFANNGFYANYKSITNYNLNGGEGLRFVPPNDTDGSTIEIRGTNAAQTVDNWSINKGGGASFASMYVAGTTSLNGKTTTAASTTSAAGLNIPQGTAPTSPSSGDIWTTTLGVYARINGTTIGPFGTVSTGSGYKIPAYGSASSSTVGPSNITTDATGNNLNVPGTVAAGATISACAVNTNGSGVLGAATCAGAGAGITTGPTKSVSGDVTTFTGTSGQIQDSGVLLTSLAPKASPTFTGTPDASGATQFKLPVAAGGAAAANGEFIYDTTNKNWHAWQNAVDALVATFPASSLPTNGNCAQWVVSSNVITLGQAGAACGTGGSGDTITSPNSTLTVGGTTSNTTLDVTGAAGKILAGATPALTSTPTLGVAGSSNGTLTLASITATGSITLTPASAASPFTVTIPAATDTMVNLAGAQTLTNKSISGSEINSGLIAATYGGTGINNTATLTLGSSNQNWATLGTGIVKNTTTTGALSNANATDVGTLINQAQYQVIVSGGTSSAPTSIACGAGQVLQGASSANPTCTAAPTLGASGTLGSVALGNATSGTVTVQPQTGALGSTTIYIPAAVNSPATLVQVVAKGTTALATSSISSGACQAVSAGTTNSSSATNVATTDVIQWGPAVSIQGVSGYAVSTSGALSIDAYPTSGYVNFNVCNWTTASVTPGALTLNWRVER